MIGILFFSVLCAALIALDVLLWHANKRVQIAELHAAKTGYGSSWATLNLPQQPPQVGDLAATDPLGLIVRWRPGLPPVGIFAAVEEKKTINLREARFYPGCYFPRHSMLITTA